MSPVRFYRLGLVTNPFFHRAGAEARDPGPGTPLAERLLRGEWRAVMLTGRRGAGKTHLVDWLLWHLRRQGRTVGYLHLDAPGRVALPGRGVEAFALDEAQRARPEDLRALARWVEADPAKRLLITTHEDVSKHLAPLAVRHEEVDGVSREELDGYLARRLAESALPGRECALTFPEVTRERLLVACEGNFLHLVDLLYQICEELPEDGRVTPAHVDAASEKLPPRPAEH